MARVLAAAVGALTPVLTTSTRVWAIGVTPIRVLTIRISTIRVSTIRGAALTAASSVADGAPWCPCVHGHPED
ncbi:hypothetical protein KBY76_04095 [Synechococcus sp. GreenBA-s]|nr:hypothetical protein [Synechococcus sp. GreenBA-s]